MGGDLGVSAVIVPGGKPDFRAILTKNIGALLLHIAVLSKNIVALRLHIAALPKNIAVLRFRIIAMTKKIAELRFRIVAMTKNIVALRFRIIAVTKNIVVLRFRIVAVTKNITALRFHTAALPKNIAALRFHIVVLSKSMTALRFQTGSVMSRYGFSFRTASKAAACFASISGVAVGITRLGFGDASFGTESSTWARPGFSHSGSGESSFRLPSALTSTSVSKVFMPRVSAIPLKSCSLRMMHQGCHSPEPPTIQPPFFGLPSTASGLPGLVLAPALDAPGKTGDEAQDG
jgi:hypothetical protein